MTRTEKIAEAVRRKGENRPKMAPLPRELAYLECIYRGPETGERTSCVSCKGNVQQKVFFCNIHADCTLLSPIPGKACCATCPERKAPPHTLAPVPASFLRRFDEKSLWAGIPGKRFNPSIVEWAGAYAFVARNGWKGSEIYAGFLNHEFLPVGGARKLELTHPAANYGREDPRLFVHNGKLHVAYAGVVGGGRIRHTNVCYARLGANFKVDEIVHPVIEGRHSWEKNHSPFSHDGRLYAVYSINPHRIVRWADGKAEWFAEESFRVLWDGGEWRGGAAPVQVGDEYWHFAHDRITVGGLLTYRTLLYTFQAKPPFRPLRYSPVPLLVPDSKTKPRDQYASVVFVGGAVRVGKDWVLAHGIHDRWTELHKFSHAELEARLVPISGSHVSH